MRNLQRPGRSPVMAPTAMVATSHPLATQVGIDILKAGGNAVDAAIAACATLCVVEPAMTGIGGDCFALYMPKGSSTPIALNGSGKAPLAASVDALQEIGVENIEIESPHSVTIPGAVAAWTKLNSDYGSKDMEELLRPAIYYGENGFPIAPRVGVDWAELLPKLLSDEVSSRILTNGGKAPAIGSTFYQPLLAATLRKIAKYGRDAFYIGEIAEDIVTRLNELGGMHTLDDFASCSAEYVDPIDTEYRGYSIHECPPNGQGICALIILSILSKHKITDLNEVDRIHLLAEATKLAYRQRNHYISDPCFSEIPVKWLLSDEHITYLTNQINFRKATIFEESDFPHHSDTTYLCCVDGGGNAVSFINSLFSGFGSGIMAPTSGVIMQNRGSSFQINNNHVNRIEGGKRPLHTIIPGMITRSGQTIGPFGVMGGQYQSTGHSNFISNIVDLNLDIQQAMDQPRSFAIDGKLQLEDNFCDETTTELERRGHEIENMNKPLGGSQCIWIDHDNGVLIGGSDPRKDGCAIGY
ncbi:MAG: gamma-glutamyltransferase [Rhodospirillaceae bacterium]|nr:gamma-glutamyltransferase [Rhodospirillaceae bacterium]